MTRAFIAVALAAAVRERVATEIERLRPLCRAVAWVPAENLHLTLKFLGDQPDDRLRVVVEALGAATAGSGPFALGLRGLGAFPGLERPRILWIGFAEGILAVQALQARLEALLAERGFPREDRPWHPHVTVGRVFDPRRFQRERTPALEAAVTQAARADFGVFAVERLALVRSDLSPRGARYSEIAAVALQG